MTKDKLEQFVIDNKDEFDEIELSAGLWQGVGKIEPKSKLKRYSIHPLKWVTRIAAAILLFIGSYYFHDFRSYQKQLSNASSSQNEDTQLYNTLIEAEYYYTAQIGVEKEKFYKLAAGNSLLRDEIQNELKELDKEFSALKEDLKDNADNEEIIAAMIQNYRLKLSILQDMMRQMQQVKKEKYNSDEINLIQI
ncbi:MAG: hypothetical protein QM503_09985 [Bacteroidota bacterium]